MAPNEILKETLASLREARRRFMSQDWLDALENRPPAECREGAMALFRVNETILVLGNKELATIRDKLKENEEALIKGATSLNEALENLKQVRKVLDTVNAFLKIADCVAAMAV